MSTLDQEKETDRQIIKGKNPFLFANGRTITGKKKIPKQSTEKTE